MECRVQDLLSPFPLHYYSRKLKDTAINLCRQTNKLYSYEVSVRFNAFETNMPQGDSRNCYANTQTTTAGSSNSQHVSTYLILRCPKSVILKEISTL